MIPIVKHHALIRINRILDRRFGMMLLPSPPGGKSVEEHANVAETHHPSRGGLTVRWMREVARITTEARGTRY